MKENTSSLRLAFPAFVGRFLLPEGPYFHSTVRGIHPHGFEWLTGSVIPVPAFPLVFAIVVCFSAGRCRAIIRGRRART